MQDVLKDLIETPGVSGDEARIRKTIEGYIEDDADALKTDTLGNLLAYKGDPDADTTVMVVTHMDQIGLRVKRIDDDGMIYGSKTGGVTRMSLPTQRVRFYNADDEPLGVVGTKPPHLMNSKERKKVPEMDEMPIDVGANSKEDVNDMGIGVGDYAVFDRDLDELANNYVTGPALDNRAGCAVGIEAFKNFDEDYQLVSVFSVQEEVGLKGAKTAAYGVDPDVALAVDTSIAGDTPTVDDLESDLETGEGPVITLQESNGRALITTPAVEDWLRGTAATHGHDYQLDVGEGGATDAAKTYLSQDGIHSGSIGIPTRYIHSSTEVVSLDDMDAAVAYLDDAFATLPDYDL